MRPVAVEVHEQPTRSRPSGAVPRAGEPVVHVRGLRKAYGERVAVRGIDLEVHAAEVFTFLGPNGAGKTTTVEILEGFRARDAGAISVLGVDPARPTRGWRSRIGVVLQSCDVWPELTVGEALTLFGRYYPAPLPVERTLALVGLSRERDVRAGALSGGQKRRLDVGLALVGDPDLLFLDEPTTGFDPSARHHAWDVIAGLRDLGKAVFLTTHYMDEAEALADRVAVIVDGAIVAEGRPRELGGRARDLVTVRFDLPDGIDATSIPPVPGGVLELCDGSARIRTTRPTETLAALTGWAVAEHLELPRLEARRPSLEDIYLQLSEGR